MVNLDQISDKLRKILNGTDAECVGIQKDPSLDFAFMVATEGVHFDSTIENKKNRIPVFVGQLGGEFNAVEGLEEADYSINILVYFPLRFKTQFHTLEEYLVRCLVGRMMTWGNQKARTNISPAQYGEIEEIDTKQLELWVESVYRQKVETSEKWCSMTFTLYLSTAKGLGEADGYIMGDQFRTELTYKGITASPEFANASDRMSCEPDSQQILGESHVKSSAGTSQYSFTISFYAKDDAFCRKVIGDIISKGMQGSVITIRKTVALSQPIEDSSDYIVLDATIPYSKGELAVITLTLGDR